MDLESGEWLRDVEVHNQDGTVSSYKKGESSGQLLRGWRTALLQCSPDERARVLDNIPVWGQPRAWTDEKIASWMIEFIASEYGQCLAFGDCLASQWSEAVCLRAWLSGVVWAPDAPDVTSWLQEADTHEHSQLKSEIRQVKGEMHRALESEWLVESKKQEHRGQLRYPNAWGPYECLHVVSEAYARFREKYKAKVPLEGLQANQILRVRPRTSGLQTSVRHSNWSQASRSGPSAPRRGEG